MDDEQLQSFHRHCSADCFNRCWAYLDKPERTPEEVEEMLLLAQASLWHWQQRSDCQPTNLSIGYWQVSRAYALSGQYDSARQFGERSLQVSRDAPLPPFYLGYAYEALARAEMLHPDAVAAREYLTKARAELDQVMEPGDRDLLAADLTALERTLASL